jgi:hypothetical protein
MPYVYKEVEVEIDLDDFDTDELIEELERRGRDYNTQGVDADEMRGLLEKIWIKRRCGSANFDRELDALIWGVLGRAA